MKHTFKYTFESVEEFNEIVKYLNTTVGRGGKHWSINGEVLKYVKHKPISRTIVIRKYDLGKEVEFFLTMKGFVKRNM